MENNGSKTVIRKTFSEILGIVRKNIILIFLIVAIAIGGGVAYIMLAKPNYTAHENVIYKAEVPEESKTKTTSSVAAMSRYFSTVVDFCTTGSVLDRADFYYDKYMHSTYNLTDDVDGFIKKFKEDKPEYFVTSKERVYYSLDSVTVTSSEKSKYVIGVSVKDSEVESAKAKLRILVLSYNEEIRDAFAGVTTYIQETVDGNSGISCASDISKTRVLLISGALGLLLAIFIIFIKSNLDNTIKDKDEIEELTGANVLAFLENQEGKNGRKKHRK